MSEAVSTSVPEEASGSKRLAILLAMAMFVLVVDTSLMNVSIAASSLPILSWRVAFLGDVVVNQRWFAFALAPHEPVDERAERRRAEREQVALQVALLIPILAGVIGLFNSFRMMRLPDPKPSAAAELALG